MWSSGGNHDGTYVGGTVIASSGVLGADAAAIDFTNLSQSFDHLIITGEIRTDRAGNVVDGLLLKFNNDGTAGNYIASQLLSAQNTTVTALRATAPAIIPVDAADSAANCFSPIVIEIPRYTGNKYKSAQARCQQHDATPAMTRWSGDMGWKNTAAITRVTFAPENGTNILAGSYLTVIGLKGTV